MRFSKFAALSVAALIGFATPAAAQTSTQMTAARQLVEISGAVQPFEAFPVTILEQSAARFAVTNQDAKFRAALNEVVAALRSEFASRKAEMVEEVAAVYAAKFSEVELKEIAAFYTTPTGKKFVAEFGIISQQTLEKIKSIGGRVSTDVASRLREEMKKKGFTI